MAIGLQFGRALSFKPDELRRGVLQLDIRQAPERPSEGAAG